MPIFQAIENEEDTPDPHPRTNVDELPREVVGPPQPFADGLDTDE